MTDSNTSISFVAAIPARAAALKIDGGANEGGSLTLDVPGTDLPALLFLAMTKRADDPDQTALSEDRTWAAPGAQQMQQRDGKPRKVRRGALATAGRKKR